MHRGGNVVGDALGQPQRYAAAGGNALGLLLRHGGGIVPGVAVNQLAHVGGILPGGQAVQSAGSQVPQARRGQHGLIPVAHGGIRPRPGSGDIRGPGKARLQGVDLVLHRGDLRFDLLAGGIGPAALDNGGLQLGQVAGGGGIVPAGEILPQGHDFVGNGAVQLQGGVGVQIGGQGVFQLLQLQALGLDLGHGLQGPGAVIGGSDDLALSHLFPLVPGMAQGPGLGAEGFLLPHQPAGGLHGFLRGAGIHPGGGVGVRQIPHPLDQKIEHHRRRQGNGQNFECAGGLHIVFYTVYAGGFHNVPPLAVGYRGVYCGRAHGPCPTGFCAVWGWLCLRRGGRPCPPAGQVCASGSYRATG